MNQKTYNFLFVAQVIACLYVLLAPTPSFADGEIRKSSRGICHVYGESRWYDKMKHFESYDSMDECLDPDGRATKTDEYVPKYKRNFFGSGWADEDKDGQNTRAEELIKQSTGAIYFRSGSELIVDRGRWLSTFTDGIITLASKADVDHTVALKWAWDHGAYQWDYEKRVKFANDPINLAVVEFNLNRSKGAKGPTEWLPPSNRCSYILRFTRIYKTYGLQLSINELENFNNLKLKECGQ